MAEKAHATAMVSAAVKASHRLTCENSILCMLVAPPLWSLYRNAGTSDREGQRMSGKKRTSDNGQRAAWREIPWEWRRPQPLEITGLLTVIPLVAAVAGYVPEGPATLSAAAAFAVNSLATFVARCVRRTRS